MAQAPNKLLRILVPVGILVLGVIAFTASILNSGRSGTRSTPQTSATTAPAAATGATGQTETPAAPPAAAATEPEPSAAPALQGLHAQVFSEPDRISNFDPIGSADPASPYEAQVEFTTLGAGVRAVTLSHHYETIKRDAHTVVQHEYAYTPPPGDDPAPATQVVAPMAADSVEIDGQVVSLLGFTDDPNKGRLGSPVWRQTAPGAFEAIIVDGEGRQVARVERRYTLDEGSYTIQLRQQVHNLTDRPLRIRWFQYGPTQLQQDPVAYGGDIRRLIFGYLLSPQAQGNDPTVLADRFVWPWGTALEPYVAGTRFYETTHTIWPNPDSIDHELRLVWAGLKSRYFGAAIFPLVPPNAGPNQKVFAAAATVNRVLLQRILHTPGSDPEYAPVLVLHTASEPRTVAPGQAAAFDMGYYAGPLSRPVLTTEPAPAAVGLSGLVIYNFGGMCAWCTFAPLTWLLLAVLRFLATYVVFDWALAIILLVIIVRTLLHPVTKWSQIRMARFGKQMQDLAPKQRKIQERYANDPQRLREETAKLWREEGVSPTGMLGCLPAFLQSPIWIALSAMLFFAFDLRHEAAFFGVFQRLTNNSWSFLGDLAEPDQFISFGRTLFTLPILGAISSINLLPILLGVVFFIQQKYLTPPTTTQLTPEQEQQQKIMKVMMVVLFPLMMYAAPSGLALYFIANSTLAILESKYIRSHIDRYNLLTVPKRPAGPKPGGFMERLQKLAEERQRQMMKQRGMNPPPRRRG